MPKCPICRNPHDTYGGVAVHMWKKEDEAHDMAESKDEGLIWLSENGHIGSDTSNQSTDTSTRDPEPATTDGGSVSEVSFPENPDADDEPTTESAPASQNDPTTAPTVCPGCESTSVVDAVAMLRRRNDLKAPHKQLLRESDYVCESCGGVFDA